MVCYPAGRDHEPPSKALAREAYAFTERSFIECADSSIHELPNIPDLSEQPRIGLANQQRALLELLKLPCTFIGEPIYLPPRIIVIAVMFYETQAGKLGNLLHD